MPEFLGHIPLGQFKNAKKPSNHPNWKQESVWKGAELMSFEAWCACTLYDPTESDGGERFQRLMHFNLGGDNEYSSKTPWTGYPPRASHQNFGDNWKMSALSTSYYPEPGKARGGEFNRIKSKEGGGGHSDEKTWDVTYMSKYAGHYEAERSGGWDGYSGGREQECAYYDLGDPQTDGCSFMRSQVNKYSVPFSCFNWWQATGLQTISTGGRPKNYDTQRFPGVKETKDLGKSGHVSMGNRMAAVYGLYFYPKCDEAARNWVQLVDYDKHRVRVRMRSPNPNYVWEGNELRVYEPLPTTKEYLDNNGDGLLVQAEGGGGLVSPGYLGGARGFKFPKLRKKPFYAYDMLAYPTNKSSEFTGGDEGANRSGLQAKDKADAVENLLMLVSPVHSEEITNAVEKARRIELRPKVPQQAPRGAAHVGTAPENWTLRAKEYKRVFGDIAHYDAYDVDGYGKVVQACGWRPASALWIFPHCETQTAGTETLKSGERHSKVPLQIVGSGGGLHVYQNFPRFVKLGLAKDVVNFMDLLQAPLENKRVTRQEFALLHNVPEDPRGRYMTRQQKYRENMRDFDSSAPQVAPQVASVQAAAPDDEDDEAVEYGEEDDDEPEVLDVPPGAIPLPDPAPQPAETGEEAPAQPETDMSIERQLNGTEPDELTTILAGMGAGNVDYNQEDEDYASTVEGMSKKQQEEHAKRRAVDLLRNPLPPGSARRAKDGALNEHWNNESEQPWPPRHLYMRPQSFFCFKKLQTKEMVEKYRELYGNVSNLFLRDGDEPKQIESVAMRIGFARTVETEFVADDTRADPSEGVECTDRLADSGKLILDLPLNFYKLREYASLPAGLKERGREHMRRIIAIYFDDSGALSTGANGMSAAKKREGMVKGLWITEGGGQYQRPKVPETTARLGLKNIVKPVFRTHPRAALKKSAPQWGPQQKEKPKDKFSVDFVETKMTIREWVQSPWSYQYLPYQARNSYFEDGETYSEGCTRCGRPFFEYKTEYHAYHNSEDGTFHYPHLYWLHNIGPTEGNRAPQPFHDSAFWGGQEVAQARNTARPVEPLQPGGDAALYHNWETHRFRIKDPPATNPMKLELQYRTTKQVMQGTGSNRKRGQVKAFQSGKGPLTFRKTIGNMYHEGREGVYISKVPGVDLPVQGRMDIGAAKVRFGMTDYKLQRCTRYTNCCRDCAATLEFAPGLLKRNVKEIVQIDPGAAAGQRKNARAGDQAVAAFRMRKRMRTWWSSVADLVVPGSNADDGKFDPRFMVGGNRVALRASYGTRFELVFQAHMDVLEQHLNQSTCRDLTNTDGMGITKVTSVDLSTQSYFQSRKRGRASEGDLLKEDSHRNKQLEHLNKILELMNAWTKGKRRDENVTWQSLNYTLNGETKLNHTLLHALHDMQYRVGQLEYHKDPTAHKKKFDPDFRRVEERAYAFETAKHQYEGSRPPLSKYNNCLRLLTYQPLKGTSVSKRQFKEDYEEVVYLYNKQPDRTGPVLARRGEAKWKTVASTHQWRGDGYVLAGRRDGRTSAPFKMAHESQTRQLKQSRLFITYSLHRAVTSNDEAHLIMTKMGDAVRKVFGNDRTLCELLLFGMKLESENTSKPDIISAKRYVPIKGAKKEGTLFYGGATPVGMSKSSYQHDNYDTHVDSVDVDAGIEIGPTLHHPHFHLILTVNHFSYVQLDTYRMKVMFESMFKGLGASPDQDLGSVGEFKLLDAGGLPFYGDNENPYVDIRLWPTDNWQEVMAAYVRKSATPSIMENLRTRAGPPAR